MQVNIFLAKIHGNMFTIWMGQEPLVVLNGCETIRNGLISHSEELSGRPNAPIFAELARGKGVIFSSGHNWKQQRRFGLMTMRNLGLGKKSLEGRIQDEAQHLLDVFASTKGQSFDPDPALLHSVSNVIAAMAFGHRFSTEDKDFIQLMETNEIVAKYLSSKWVQLFNAFPWLMRRLPGPHQDLIKANVFIETFVKNEIQNHKDNGVPEEPQDLIDLYLIQISKTSDDPTSTFDEENMMRMVVEFFTAAMHTTTVTLYWAILYMVNQPTIQENVQKELDAVLGRSHIITYEDRTRLPYTNAVIHEIQRHSRVGAFTILRQVTKDTSLHGINIQKGTILVANLYSSLYDPDYWETPQQFTPSHFLDKKGNFVTNDAFLPFAAGHRVCLGEQLARTKLFIFFANLLRAFSFRLPDAVKEVNMNYIFGAFVQPHPYKICAIPRQDESSLK